MDEVETTEQQSAQLSEEEEFEAIIALIEERIVEKLTRAIERVIQERGGV